MAEIPVLGVEWNGNNILISEIVKVMFMCVHTGSPTLLSPLIDLAQSALCVNVADADGNIPLHIAVGNGNEACVEILVGKGSALNTLNTRGSAPIHVAAFTGSLSILQTLINSGADINVRDKKNNTPLIIATRKGHLGCVQALIQGGADHLAKNEESFAAIHKAAYHGHPECLWALVKAPGSDVDIMGQRGFAPLHFASKMSHARCLEILLDAGANTESLDDKGSTPLHVASHMGSIDCLEILVERRANVEARTLNGATPLLVALLSSFTTGSQLRTACAILLAHGAHVVAVPANQGAAIPGGVRFSPGIFALAEALARARQTSLGPECVSEARLRMLSAVSRTDSHALFKAVNDDEVMRPIVAQIMVDASTAAAAAALASTGDAETPAAVQKPCCFSRSGLVFARAELLTQCAAAAENDAAQSSIALLSSRAAFVEQPKRTRLTPAELSGGDFATSGEQPRTLTKAEEMKVYASAMCVGRWGQISAAKAAAKEAEEEAFAALTKAREGVVAALRKIGDAFAAANAAVAEAAEAWGDDESEDDEDVDYVEIDDVGVLN